MLSMKYPRGSAGQQLKRKKIQEAEVVEQVPDEVTHDMLMDMWQQLKEKIDTIPEEDIERLEAIKDEMDSALDALRQISPDEDQVSSGRPEVGANAMAQGLKRVYASMD